MKKNDQDFKLSTSNVTSNKALEIDKFKTTNVNILLNRVRLDKKKSIRKKLFISTVLLAAMSGLIAYLLI